MTRTQELINWVCALRFEDLPAQTKAKAKLCILDYLSCCLAARNEASAQLLLEVLKKFGAAGQASVIGNDARLSVEQAALVNGALSHIWEIDETHRFTMSHPGNTILSVVFAMGEWLGSSGPDMMTAMIAGYEVALRICNAVSPSHLEKGWHPTGTTNTFGAAVAAGKLLGLDPTQMAWAIGIATTQAAGTFCHIPERAMTKDLNPGKAGASGILAAMLAREGFTGSPTAIENKKGFIHTHADASDLDLLVRDLGNPFKIDEIAFKPYSCCRHCHAAIDALLNLRAANDMDPQQIESIQVRLYPMALFLVDDPDPFEKGFFGSRYSVQFNIALALIEGEEGMYRSLFDQAYTQSMLKDDRIRGLVRRVAVEEDAGLAAEWPDKWPAIIKVVHNDGRVHEKRIDYPLGEPEHPVSRDQLLEKFRRASEGYLGEERIREVQNVIEDVEKLAHVGTLLKLVSGRQAPKEAE